MKLLSAAAVALSLCAAAGVAACSSSGDSDTPTDTTNEADADVGEAGDGSAVPFPAPHPSLPQVVTNGGPILAKPVLVPVFFPGFDYKTQMVDFAAKLAKSSHWKAVATEYGIGAPTVATAIDVATPPPALIYNSDVKAWLTSRFDGTHPEFGNAPVEGAIYTLFYPTATTIDQGNSPDAGDGGARQPHASCDAFGGFHDDIDIKGNFVAYAVIPECATFNGITGVELATATTSHEWIEAASDPYVHEKAAYQAPDLDHLIWGLAFGGGEVGDMCAQTPDAFYKPADVGYTVQRSWSNIAAKAGNDPCVPAEAGAPYFNTATVLPDDVDYGLITTKGLKVPVGKSRTMELDLFSTGDTGGAWKVEASPFALSGGGIEPTAAVSVTLSAKSGVNGDKINLTVKANSAPTGFPLTPILVTSTRGNIVRFWVGVVGN